MVGVRNCVTEVAQKLGGSIPGAGAAGCTLQPESLHGKKFLQAGDSRTTADLIEARDK